MTHFPQHNTTRPILPFLLQRKSGWPGHWEYHLVWAPDLETARRLHGGPGVEITPASPEQLQAFGGAA